MESSIAVFLLRQPACERLPTSVSLLCGRSWAQRSAMRTRPQNARSVRRLNCPGDSDLKNVSLFQPKTATLKDIAIALMKIHLFAGWRSH